MATWKKVVVSGSNISQLNNDAGFLTSVTSQNAFATASVNGVLITADNSAGSLIYASSSGAGLNLVGSSAPDTVTFNLSAIPNASLANSAVTVGSTAISLGATATTLTGLTSVSSTSFTGSLFGTSSWANNATTATTATTATNATNTAVTDTVTGTGPYYISFVSSNTGNQPQLVDSTGLTYNATTNTITATASYASAVSPSGLPGGIVSASVLSAPATQGQVQLTTNGVAAAAVTIQNLGTTGNPTFNNVIISGDLTVSGTTTAVNTANLFVADQFILIASGSANNTTDGGIIVDRGTYAAGNIAIGYDAATFRWGLQDGLTDSVNAVDLGASTGGVSGSFLAHVFTEATHGATKPITGEFAVAGAIYTSTTGDIFMYS